MGFPLLYLFMTAVLFDIPGSGCISILLSPSYYVLSALAMVVGYGLWEVKRWSWYLFIFTNFLVGYENAVFVHEYGMTHHKWVSFLSSTVILLVIAFRVAKEIRVPYFFPRIRWWESNPRHKLAVPTRLLRQEGEALEGQIMDISIGGCFIKLHTELDLHEAVELDYSVFGISMKCRGLVVWKSRSSVTTPKGIGVKFNPLPKSQKRLLRGICQRLRKISQLYRRSRYLLNQEEFLRRLSEIESRGKSSKPPAPPTDRKIG